MSGSRNSLWRKAGGWLLLPLILPMALIIIPILHLLGLNKTREGPERIIDYLKRFADGVEDEWDWDDFCSVPFADQALDDIRERACRHGPPGTLTDDARADLRQLIEEARALGRGK